MEAAAIQAEGLTRRYGRRLAVDNVDLAIAPGEIFGFLGANGAGKSSTIKMLLGLIRPSAGRVLLFGRPPDDPAVRRRLGFLPEQFRFPEWLTAAELMDYHGRLLGIAPAERRTRGQRALEQVGLAGRGGDRLRGFSKGMLQRAGLAQALMGRPSLIFLDEPTSGLDPVGRADVRQLIQGLRAEGVTVFLNSHILSDVETVCDRVAILHAGKVAAAGPLTTLLHPDTQVDIRVGGIDAPAIQALGWPAARMEGNLWRLRLPDDQSVPELARRLIAAGAELYDLHLHQRSLEDLFLGISRPEAPAC
ncbi:MAG TPA: ABC transporter ATP-binding protein [Chloroflexota bacterium]|nr:ABC transporter ATP-binding protein [Chloroflexota bacterium]